MKEYNEFDSLGIMKSRIRQEVFSLFFTNPEQKYYLRQLERLLGFSAGNIRRELLRLAQSGLLLTEKHANLLYYSLNAGHALYPEIKSIVLKTIGIVGSLKKILSDMKNIRVGFIYGSFAARSENKSSDVDVFIIGSPDISGLNVRIRELEQKLGREMDVTVYSIDEYERKKKGKRRFLTEILKRPKIFLIGQGNDL